MSLPLTGKSRAGPVRHLHGQAPAAKELGLQSQDVLAVPPRLELEPAIALAAARHVNGRLARLRVGTKQVEVDAPVGLGLELQADLGSLPPLHLEAIGQRESGAGVDVHGLPQRRYDRERRAQGVVGGPDPVAAQGGVGEPRLDETVAIGVVGVPSGRRALARPRARTPTGRTRRVPTARVGGRFIVFPRISNRDAGAKKSLAAAAVGCVVQGVRDLEASSEVTPLYMFRYRTPDTGVEVRDGFASDASALAAIGARAFVHAHSGAIHPVDLAGVAARFEPAEIRADIDQKRARWLVAQWSGDTVGGAQLRVSDEPAEFAGRHPIELGGIYVAPDWSGYGVGSALVEGCIRLARKLGARRALAPVLREQPPRDRVPDARGLRRGEARDGRRAAGEGPGPDSRPVVLTRAGALSSPR